MKAAANWLGTLFVALCVGTVISLAVLVGMLWWKGALTDDRWLGMLAALQGIEPAKTAATAEDPAADEQPSLTQLMERRLGASLDLELRETAIDKSLGDLRTLGVANQDRERAARQVEAVVRHSPGEARIADHRRGSAPAPADAGSDEPSAGEGPDSANAQGNVQHR